MVQQANLVAANVAAIAAPAVFTEHRDPLADGPAGRGGRRGTPEEHTDSLAGYAPAVIGVKDFVAGDHPVAWNTPQERNAPGWKRGCVRTGPKPAPV